MEIACRSRKKRCYHVEKSTRAQGAARPDGLAPPEPPSEVDTRESSPSPGRVSEYNPESVLADLSKMSERTPNGGQPEPSRDNARPRKGLAQSEQTSSASRKMQRQLIWYKRHKRRAAPPKLSESHRRYLEEAGAFLELPSPTTDTLLPIYVSLLDDLLPIMDGAGVFRDYSNGTASRYLLRAMCLVACKYKQAASSLRLGDDGPLLEPLDFGSQLLAGLDAAIKADLEPDRVTKVQVLALMHLHNDGLAGGDRSSKYLSHAISEAWAMSLHFNIPGNSDQDQCDYLWWSLRNLDRLNKPVMGAGPFLINDTDIEIDRIAPRNDSYRSQIMGVTLTLGDLMAKATKVYKASSKSTVDDCAEFPALAKLTAGTGFDHFHKSHKGEHPLLYRELELSQAAYLEIWYHVTAMLSCRYSGPGSVQYNRRLASADCILDILTRTGHENLPPLPLVPYAMSMSTTMIYRALRDDQRGLGSACKDLGFCCDALDALSQRWTSTKYIARLAKRLWRVLSKSLTLNGAPDQARERTEDSGPADGTANTDNETANMASQQVERTAELGVSMGVPAPVPGSQNIPGQPARPMQNWTGMDASYFQLDRAFGDLFDFRMAPVFRNPTTWEFTHAATDEESCLSSELQFAPYFASPEMELGYHQPPSNGAQDLG